MALKIQTKLPTRLPPKAKAYALTAPKVSAAALKATARALGLETTTKTGTFDVLSAADRIGLAGQRWSIEMHRASGAIVATDIDRYGLDTGVAFELSDRRAETIARKFVEAGKLLPLKSAAMLKVTHLNVADGDVKGGPVTQRVIDAGVVFGRTVDDLPVTGPGGHAMVHVHGDGSVVGLRSLWRPLGRSLGTVKLAPIDAALERLEKLLAGVPGEATLVKAHTGYFEWGAFDRQTVLEPVHVLVYVVRNEHIASKHVHIEHAGHLAYGKLLGRRRFPAGEQKPRRADEPPR